MLKTDCPLISIIMPAYNAGAYIKDSISSVLEQSYKNWELLVIDDGSTDDTSTIITEFLNDTRIRYVYQPNGGVAAARNHGLKLAQGEFISFLDADDFLTTNSLIARWQVFEQNNEIKVVGGSVELFDEQTGALLDKRACHQLNESLSSYFLSWSTEFTCGITLMYKRADEPLKPYALGMTHAEDWLFNYQNTKNRKFKATQELVYRYRIYENSAMSNLDGFTKGYLQYLSALKADDDVDEQTLLRLKKRLQMIVVKTWLKSGRFFKALKSYWKFQQFKTR